MNDTIVNETPESKGNKTLVIGAVLVVLALVGIGAVMTRSSSRNSTNNQVASVTEHDSTESSPTTVAMSPAVEGATDTIANDVKIVEVEAGSFYYKPNEIRVKKGEKVKLTLKSVDMMHDLNIDELGVKVPVTRSGNTATVEFTADKIGEFEMYCSVGQHRKNGQVGTLIVE